MDLVDREGVLPLYVQVQRRIRRAILDGTLTDRVPSERALARQYGIAQMTVRRALAGLVDEGILTRQVGRGTFVCRPGTAPRKTYQLGFALHPAVAGGIRNPYFSHVLHGAEQTARAHGFSIVFTSAVEELLHTVHSRSRRKVDGILAVAIDDEEAVHRCARVVPTVVLDNEFDGVACVVADNEAGAYTATAHLVALGHRRIAHLAGSSDSAVGRARLAGYRKALLDAGLPCHDSLVVPGTFDSDAGHAGVGALQALPEPPTAIFCVNDAVALGAMKRLKNMGRRVPDDVSILGFDDIETAAFADPPLTTVRVDQERLGALAAEMLLAAVHHRQAPAERSLVPVELVVRQSCRPPHRGGFPR